VDGMNNSIDPDPNAMAEVYACYVCRSSAVLA